MDKFDPASSGGKMSHAEESVGKLVVTGGDGAVDLEVAEHTFNVVTVIV